MDVNNFLGDDHEFVELFKKRHNDQFYVLVKMHLSFLIHMSTEESECFYEKVKQKKWNIVPFSGKKSSKKSIYDAVTLTQEALGQIYQLITVIKKDENLNSEGLFRLAGSKNRQNGLKSQLLQGEKVNFTEELYSVHDCASVLKGILADLPEPLTTDIQFPIYCQIAQCYKTKDPCHQAKLLQSIQLLLLLLPNENRLLLHDILELLHQVMLHEDHNKMPPENLAKMFAMHLLCPRKLAPETLIKESPFLFDVVALMIRKFTDLFKVPAQLMLDFRAHYEQDSILNDSVKDTAHTVFTFVDNKLTAKENEENVTETALAQLYAHIQSMPESSKKRKLVKQFNKENGQGTPLQVLRSSGPKNKSFGDSIKKHMFHRKLLRNVRKSGFAQLKSASSEEILNSPQSSQKASRGHLFCHNFDSSSDDDDKAPKRVKSSQLDTPVERTRRKRDSGLSLGDVSGGSEQYLTSTPACRPLFSDVFTPESQDRKSMSPITRSAQRMPRAMQETMMTPRSRKPVLLVSGTNINNLAKVSTTLTHLQEEEGQAYSSYEDEHQLRSEDNVKKLFTKSKSDGDLIADRSEKEPKLNKTDSPQHTLTDTFRQYLVSRDMLTFNSPTDSTFSSRSDDFQISDNSLAENNLSSNLTDSMLCVLDGNCPDDRGEKEPVLKPRQFDEDGNPVVFETSF